MRRRLDVELVRRGLLPSRAQASSAIAAGHVLVSGAPAITPARLVAPGEPIELRRRPRFVSRGGEKLDAALARFGVEVAGRRCLDVGASTGGFTDCLLQRGAAEVVAVDVGHGQLDWRLRNDPRVRVREGLNARALGLEHVDGTPVGVVTADLSFISLRLVARPLALVGDHDAHYVVLVKPQFEAGPSEVGRGGIVRDPEVHRRVVVGVAGALEQAGLGVAGAMVSPIRGGSGNVEFCFHLRRSPRVVDDAALEAVVQEAWR